MFSIKTTIRVAATAVLLGTAPIALAGSDQTVTVAATMGGQSRALSAAACMRPDVDAITWLEQRGEAQDMPGEQIFDKFMTVLHARAACRDGRVAEGLAMYDGILTATTVGSGEQRASNQPAPR